MESPYQHMHLQSHFLSNQQDEQQQQFQKYCPPLQNSNGVTQFQYPDMSLTTSNKSNENFSNSAPGTTFDYLKVDKYLQKSRNYYTDCSATYSHNADGTYANINTFNTNLLELQQRRLNEIYTICHQLKGDTYHNVHSSMDGGTRNAVHSCINEAAHTVNSNMNAGTRNVVHSCINEAAHTVNSSMNAGTCNVEHSCINEVVHTVNSSMDSGTQYDVHNCLNEAAHTVNSSMDFGTRYAVHSCLNEAAHTVNSTMDSGARYAVHSCINEAAHTVNSNMNAGTRNVVHSCINEAAHTVNSSMNAGTRNVEHSCINEAVHTVNSSMYSGTQFAVHSCLNEAAHTVNSSMDFGTRYAVHSCINEAAHTVNSTMNAGTRNVVHSCINEAAHTVNSSMNAGTHRINNQDVNSILKSLSKMDCQTVENATSPSNKSLRFYGDEPAYKRSKSLDTSNDAFPGVSNINKPIETLDKYLTSDCKNVSELSPIMVSLNSSSTNNYPELMKNTSEAVVCRSTSDNSIFEDNKTENITDQQQSEKNKEPAENPRQQSMCDVSENLKQKSAFSVSDIDTSDASGEEDKSELKLYYKDKEFYNVRQYLRQRSAQIGSKETVNVKCKQKCEKLFLNLLKTPKCEDWVLESVKSSKEDKDINLINMTKRKIKIYDNVPTEEIQYYCEDSGIAPFKYHTTCNSGDVTPCKSLLEILVPKSEDQSEAS